MEDDVVVHIAHNMTIDTVRKNVVKVDIFELSDGVMGSMLWFRRTSVFPVYLSEYFSVCGTYTNRCGILRTNNAPSVA